MDILRLVTSRGLALAATGAAIGLAGTIALSRGIASLLYGVSSADPTTLISLTLSLMAVTLLACYLPAHRAARVDPMVALRDE